MKMYINMKFAMLILLGFYMLILSPQTMAQDKQYKARLSVDYQKIMGDKPSLLINGKFKGENGYEPTVNLELSVYREIDEDSIVLVGQTTTDSKGNAQFDLATTETKAGDSIVKYTYIVKIEDDERFKDLKKAVSYQDAYLNAEAIVKDSVNYISAKFTDALGYPIEGTKLTVMVDRLFAPLTIGKSSYKTDDDGTILVPIEPLPGINGILTFEVMLDSRKYGIVRKIFDAPIGEPIVDLSTFDQRTMWSPPGKTPVFLWVFANLGILGIWGTMVFLMRNLYKIYKS